MVEGTVHHTAKWDRLPRKIQPSDGCKIKWSDGHLPKRQVECMGGVYPSFNKSTHRNLTRRIRAINESRNDTIKALTSNHLLHT